MNSRTLMPADVFAFRSLADPRLSRDGARLIATITRRDAQEDARIPSLIETRDRQTWTDLPNTDGVTLARLSPDGARIAMLRRVAGRMTVSVLRQGMREADVLHDADAPLRELAWSPDGAALAFQQRVDAPLPDWLGLPAPPDGAAWAAPPRHTDRLMYRHDATGELPESVFHTFIVPADIVPADIVPADGRAPARQLTQGSWHHGMPHHITPGLVFSADGSEVLFTGTQRPDWDAAPGDIDLHAIRVADGAVRRLTDIPGPVAHPAPSPDGRWIAFTAIEERGLSHHLRRLYVMPAEGGAPRAVLPWFDRSIGPIAWCGADLVVGYDEHGTGRLARVTIDGAMTPLAHGMTAGQIEMPYAGAGFTVADDGAVAFISSASDVPGEVAVAAPGQPAATLTHVNAALAGEVGGFRRAEPFTVAGGEGRTVQCWLILPPGPGPHPMVLEIHGGPYADYGDRFSIKHQAMVAAGYAVLYANPAGSTGYGQAFASALHDRFPGPDHDDLMAAVDAAAIRPDIDAERLFISGQSGGGVLTLWAITHDHRFRAAVAIKPVVDWQSWVLGSDIGPTVGLRWMGDELPWEAPEKYRARSPVAHAAQARTPTLLMAGEADSRTPMSETLQMYAALKLAGNETHLLRFPGATHSSSVMRPSMFASEVAATIGWFERFRT